MNAKQLRDKAQELRLDAEAKRKQADRFTYNANDYDKAGDAIKADTERAEAAKLIEDATRSEHDAEQHDRDAEALETQALDLDNQQAALQSEFDQRMKDLESKKAALRGGAGLFS
jgi:hypothetical protein